MLRSVDGIDEIYISNPGIGSTTFHFNKDSKKIVGISLCNSPGSERDKAPLVHLKTQKGNVSEFTVRCGGRLYAYDHFLKVRFDSQSQQILGLFIDMNLARWSLPNGSHSGPIKDQYENFNCNMPGHTWKTIENELRSNSGTENL